jgi:hypothetical protein
MAEGTVKVHVRQIMRKLGVANRTQVAVCALGTGSSVSDGNGKVRSSSRNGSNSS